MATKQESEHRARVAALGCIACRNSGLGETPAGIHHLRDKTGVGRRASHFEVIPLCGPHHQTGGYGVAYHAGPEIWEQKYGTQRELLEQVRRELGIEGAETD
jgi:hypothetical protein